MPLLRIPKARSRIRWHNTRFSWVLLPCGTPPLLPCLARTQHSAMIYPSVCLGKTAQWMLTVLLKGKNMICVGKKGQCCRVETMVIGGCSGGAALQNKNTPSRLILGERAGALSGEYSTERPCFLGTERLEWMPRCAAVCVYMPTIPTASLKVLCAGVCVCCVQVCLCVCVHVHDSPCTPEGLGSTT